MYRRVLQVAAVAAAIALGGAAPSAGSVIYDAGPTGAPFLFNTHSGEHVGIWSSQFNFQEFFVRATFDRDVTFQGMTVFTGVAYGTIGAPTALRIFDSTADGEFGQQIFQVLGQKIDSVQDTAFDFPDHPGQDIVAAHVTYDDLRLAAGTYWLSVSGIEGLDLGWASFVDEGASRTRYDQVQISHGYYELGDVVFFDHTTIYRLPFLIDGSVPEPSTWSLLILGLGGVGAALRRHQRTVPAGT